MLPQQLALLQRCGFASKVVFDERRAHLRGDSDDSRRSEKRNPLSRRKMQAYLEQLVGHLPLQQPVV